MINEVLRMAHKDGKALILSDDEVFLLRHSLNQLRQLASSWELSESARKTLKIYLHRIDELINPLA